jgi:hypothetical protein
MRCHPTGHATAFAAVMLILAAAPPPSSAQAWLPEKGQGTVSVLFTNATSNEHFLPDRRYNLGRIDANTILLDVTYGLSDRVAITFGIPLVMSRYRGNTPHRPITLDDGRWHATTQDFRFNLRYNVMRAPLVVTPFVATDMPSRDYQYFAHAAPGRALKELYGGVSVGRLFADLGLVVQGRYALNISEGVLDQPRRYSQVSLEGAYFLTPPLRLLAMMAGRIAHTGIDLYPDSGRVLPFEIFSHHDQISRESFTNVGGGAAYSLNDTVDVFGSFTVTVRGRNTHAVNRGISMGVSWSFGDRGNQSLIGASARERSLTRCLCEKSGG